MFPEVSNFVLFIDPHVRTVRNARNELRILLVREVWRRDTSTGIFLAEAGYGPPFPSLPSVSSEYS